METSYDHVANARKEDGGNYEKIHFDRNSFIIFSLLFLCSLP
jgi:hypothetical protein